MTTPKDKKLYDSVKKEADKIYTKPSAYKSGWIVKRYKALGGEYSGKKPTDGLTRWFNEKWTDISGLASKDANRNCSSRLGSNRCNGNSSYPVYRPTKRISSKTPLLVREIDPKNLQTQIKRKQKIKGDSNLPPFMPN